MRRKIFAALLIFVLGTAVEHVAGETVHEAPDERCFVTRLDKRIDKDEARLDGLQLACQTDGEVKFNRLSYIRYVHFSPLEVEALNVRSELYCRRLYKLSPLFRFKFDIGAGWTCGDPE